MPAALMPSPDAKKPMQGCRQVSGRANALKPPPVQDREANMRLIGNIRSLFYLLLLLTVWVGLPLHAKQDAEGMRLLLQAEFAFQEGRAEEAAALFVQAARSSADPAVAERAAQVAFLAGNDVLTKQALDRWQALAPHNPSFQLLQTGMALRGDDADLALFAAQKMFDAEPEGAQRLLQLLNEEQVSQERKLLVANALAKLKSVRESKEKLRTLLALGYHLKAYDLLDRLTQQATHDFNKEPSIWYMRAEYLRDRGRSKEALRALRRGQSVVPSLTQTDVTSYAVMYQMLGDLTRAHALLQQAEQTLPVLNLRADVLRNMKDEAGLRQLQAELRARAKADDPKEQLVRLMIEAQVLEELKDYRQALAVYQQVDEGDFMHAAQLRQAIMQHKLGELAEAKRLLRQLQTTDSEDGSMVRDAFLLEAELFAKKAPKEGVRLLGRGLAVLEDDPILLYARSLQHEQAGDLAAAEQDLRRILEDDPQHVDALNALGYMLTDRTQRHEEALKLIEQAIAIQPDQPAIIDSHGWVLFKLGRHKEALTILKRAFDLQHDAEIAAHLGEALLANGQVNEARSIIRLGAEIDAENKALIRAQTKLEQHMAKQSIRTTAEPAPPNTQKPPPSKQ